MICPPQGIERFLGLLPPELVSSEARDRLEALVPQLPGGLSHFGVEFRLAPDREQVDFASGAQWVDGGRRALTADLEAVPPPRDPAWAAVRSLCAEWSEPSSPLYFGVAGVWLEFDLDRPASTPVSPSLFVALRPEDARRPRSSGMLAGVVERVLERILEPQRVVSAGRGVRRLLAALPDDGSARLAHLAVMLPRPDPSVRILVTGLSQEGLSGVLDRIGWESGDQLTGVLDRFGPWLSTVMLGVDDEAPQRLDLELRVPPEQRRHQRLKQWSRLFAQLVEDDLVDPIKLAALEPWWRWRSSSYPDVEPCELWRTLNHVKVTYRGRDRPLGAKAYLSGRIGIFPPDSGVILLERALTDS